MAVALIALYPAFKIKSQYDVNRNQGQSREKALKNATSKVFKNVGIALGSFGAVFGGTEGLKYASPFLKQAIHDHPNFTMALQIGSMLGIQLLAAKHLNSNKDQRPPQSRVFQ